MKVHDEHKKKGPDVVNIALVIVSTSRFNELQEKEINSDKTIPLVKQILDQYPGVFLTTSEIVSDNENQIVEILRRFLNESSLHVIIFSGGTGLTPKDVTYEAIKPLLEKTIDGFGELFRYLSYKEIGASSMFSRALAGKIKDKAIFLLPGSPNAVKLAFNELILPEIKHMVYMINKKE
ncbi:MAG: MogA/MoaB family molybdenum cofactor biosynthesis protein [Candidatus Lokiarchaeota archaeon]|nr:MogA/MoaB family molybdenum cofactor biosynthesis protein [Candidatus Lokiarchaeota archaeon]